MYLFLFLVFLIIIIVPIYSYLARFTVLDTAPAAIPAFAGHAHFNGSCNCSSTINCFCSFPASFFVFFPDSVSRFIFIYGFPNNCAQYQTK